MKEACERFNISNQPDPYNPHGFTREQVLREERNIALTMTNQSEVGLKNEAARLRNVAALRRELDIPAATRRARLEAKFGGRSQDDWSVFSNPGGES